MPRAARATSAVGARTRRPAPRPSASCPGLVLERERERHGVAFLQRLREIHQHHVIAAGLQLDRLSGRQRQRVSTALIFIMPPSCFISWISTTFAAGDATPTSVASVGGGELHERAGGLLAGDGAANPGVGDGDLGDGGRGDATSESGDDQRRDPGRCASRSPLRSEAIGDAADRRPVHAELRPVHVAIERQLRECVELHRRRYRVA